jgi:hypothetical protein
MNTMQSSRQHRRRLPRSCEECRRRKVKCDRNHPCSQCVMTKCRCCYMSPHLLAGHRTQPSQTAGSSKNTLPSHQWLGLGSSSLTPAAAGEEGRSGNRLLSRPSGPCQPKSAAITKVASIRARSPGRLSSQDELVSVSGAGSASVSPMSSDTKQDSHTTLDRSLVLNKSRLFGRTHWTNAVYEVRLLKISLCSISASAYDTSLKESRRS